MCDTTYPSFLVSSCNMQHRFQLQGWAQRQKNHPSITIFWWDSTKDICLLFLEAAKDLEVSMQPVDRMPPPESSSGGPGARELPWASCVCPKLAVTSSLIPWMTQWNCQMGNQSPQPFLRQSSGRASSRFVTSAWMPTRNHSSSLANGQSLFKGCLLFGMHPLN